MQPRFRLTLNKVIKDHLERSRSIETTKHYQQEKRVIKESYGAEVWIKSVVGNTKVNKLASPKSQMMDFRIALVLFPIILALSWAGYNIGRAALGQIQLAIYEFKKNTQA